MDQERALHVEHAAQAAVEARWELIAALVGTARDRMETLAQTIFEAADADANGALSCGEIRSFLQGNEDIISALASGPEESWGSIFRAINVPEAEQPTLTLTPNLTPTPTLTPNWRRSRRPR